jgi:hypothetical protein
MQKAIARRVRVTAVIHEHLRTAPAKNANGMRALGSSDSALSERSGAQLGSVMCPRELEEPPKSYHENTR